MQYEALTNKTFLITGGAGFVGSHLAEHLLERAKGARIVCVDNLTTGDEANISSLRSSERFVFIQGDINEKKEAAAIFSAYKIDYVFHYAATVGVLRTLERPLDVLRDVEGVKNVLEYSYKSGVKKVVFSSSSEVYGEPVEIPEHEDGHLNPKLPYAIVKLFGENLLRAYYDMYRLPTCSLRFFNVYGPRQNASAYGFVAGVFMRQALSGEPITVFGDGTQTRDFVFIEDNINASIRALLISGTDGEAINVGTGRPVTVLDLAEHVKELTGASSRIDLRPLRPGGEIKHRFPDVSKMRRLLQYEPNVSLREGLRRTIEWYRGNM